MHIASIKRNYKTCLMILLIFRNKILYSLINNIIYLLIHISTQILNRQTKPVSNQILRNH